MLNALLKSIGQFIADPKLRGIMFKGIIGSLAVFILLWMFAAFALSTMIWSDIPIIGGVLAWISDFDWIVSALDALSIFAFGGAMMAATFILFPPVMTVIVGIFLEDVCEAVEGKHYPNAGPIRNQSALDSVYNALKFLGIAIGINILVLPIYIFTWWFFGLGFIVYYMVNGYLVGREYFELVALRRMDPASAAGLRRAHRGRVMLAGFVTVFAMTVPFVNLLAPVLAAAMMVHIFMGLPRRTEFSNPVTFKAE